MMSLSHHPSDAVLLAYGAGSLGSGLSLVVAGHLAVCAYCRDRVTEVEAMGGALLEDVTPAALDDGALDAMLARLDTVGPAPRPAPIAAALPKALGLDHIKIPPALRQRLAEMPSARWSPLLPGVRQLVLDPQQGRQGGSARLLRVAPGRRMPDHAHTGLEMTLVLSGGYSDNLGQYGPGDVAEQDRDQDHVPVADPGEDCICLIAQDRPPRFQGPVLGRLQRLMGG